MSVHAYIHVSVYNSALTINFRVDCHETSSLLVSCTGTVILTIKTTALGTPERER